MHISGFDCAVCGKSAHGHHFGVLSCRPCVEFFRRTTLKRKSYRCLRGGNCGGFKHGLLRKCKACRLRQCLRAGMQFGQREPFASPPSENLTNLAKLANALEQFVAHRNLLVRKCAFKKIKMSNLNNFQECMKPKCIEIFENAMDPFACLEPNGKVKKEGGILMPTKSQINIANWPKCKNERIGHNPRQPERLMENCFAQINFLASCHLTLEQFPSGHFMIDNGLAMDMDQADQIVGQLASEKENPMEYFRIHRSLVHRKFDFIQELRSLREKVSKQDFAVLMALLLCNRGDGRCNSMLHPSPDWNSYKQSILSEWFEHQSAILKSTETAAIQNAVLISMLARLDMIFVTTPKQMSIAPNYSVKREFDHLGPSSADPAIDGIKYFSHLLNCHKQIWNSFYVFDDHYLDQFHRFEDLLDEHENVLALAHSFPQNPSRGMPRKEEIKFRVRKSLYVFKLIALGVLKAMPAFRKMTIKERLLLAQRMSSSISFFTFFYYSAKIGAQTCTGPDGVTSISVLKAAKEEFGEDQRLMALAEKCFTRPVERFLSLSPMLDHEEFALLLAILCHNSIITDLSMHRDSFYAEQSRYCRLLLQYVQMKLGMEKGAKRFAECMFLVDTAFCTAQNHEMLKVYVDAIHGENHAFQEIIFPECISPLI